MTEIRVSPNDVTLAWFNAIGAFLPHTQGDKSKEPYHMSWEAGPKFGLAQGMTSDASLLWPHFDAGVNVDWPGGQPVRLIMPSRARVLLEGINPLCARLKDDQNEVTRLLVPPGTEVGQRVLFEDCLDRFATLDAGPQWEVIHLTRRVVGLKMLCYAFSYQVLPELYALTQMEGHHEIEMERRRKQHQGWVELQQELMVRLSNWLRPFLIYYAGREQELETGPVGLFLPEGEWERLWDDAQTAEEINRPRRLEARRADQPAEDEGPAPIVLGERIAEEDARLEVDRLRIYRGVPGYVETREVQGPLGNLGYVALIFLTQRNAVRVAALVNPRTKHATFIFLVAQPHQEAETLWAVHAQTHRSDLREHGAPTMMGHAVIHRGAWQERFELQLEEIDRQADLPA